MPQNVLKEASQKIFDAADLDALQQLKVEFLGKQSIITQEMKKLGGLSPEVRKEHGALINSIKDEITALIEARNSILEQAEIEAKLQQEWQDATLPPRRRKRGSIHPITQCMEELREVFSKYGFTIKDGPNIETDWYNFTALGIAEDHPARQMHDTFYLKNGKVLRTHTSPVQIRTMEAGAPPFKFIVPGRTYRSDSDMTHTPMFHQIEGLMVDRDITMGHLKYIITEFIKDFFEQPNIEVRFRPSFFPFTEPSAEVDIRWQGTTKWLEVLGCGMIHPNVLRNAKVNPEEYRGFAFGLGVERFAMLKYGIKDLRDMFAGDMRWLEHYNFGAFDVPSIFGGLSK